MEKPKGFFYFQKPGSKFIYLLVFIFCSLMRRLLPRIINDNMIKKPKDRFSDNELENMNFNKNVCFFDLLSNFIADFLAGIMILINKIKSKNTIKQIQLKTFQNLITKGDIKKKFYFYLLIIAIIDFIAQLCLFLYSYIVPKGQLLEDVAIKEENLYFVVLIDIISRYFFSRIFLNSFFYKHHIVSIIITCIGFIPLTINNLISDKFFQKKKIYLMLYIYMTIIYSLEDVINKICLNQLILRPYELMFYKSLFQILFVFILFIYAAVNNNLFYYLSQRISFMLVLYRLSFIISNIFRTWSLITIIELLNPNHLSILKSSEFAVLFVFISIYKGLIKEQNNSISFYIVGSFCCLVSIIGSAIHNEIIIINKFGLLECTDFYKTEINPHVNFDEDLEIEKEDKKNKTLDSFLGESVDND